MPSSHIVSAVLVSALVASGQETQLPYGQQQQWQTRQRSQGRRGGAPDFLGAKMQELNEASQANQEAHVAALSIACADEINSCGLSFTPGSIFVEALAFKVAQREAGTRLPLPEELRIKQDALKDCFRAMKDELSALPEDAVPVENECVQALKAARGHGSRGKPQLCADESRPACADGAKPSFDRETMSMVCSDGVSTPLCADGTQPALPEGFRSGKGSREGARGDRDFAFPQQQQRQQQQQQQPWSNFGSQFSSRFGGVYMPRQQQQQPVYMPQQQQQQQQPFRSLRSSSGRLGY